MSLSSKLIERYSFLFHWVGWAGFICLPFLLGPNQWQDLLKLHAVGFITSHVVVDALWIMFFYLNLNKITPYCIHQKTIWPLLASVFGVLVLFLMLNILLRGMIYLPQGMNAPPPRPYNEPMPVRPPAMNGLMLLPFPQFFSCFFVTSISSGIALWRDHVHTQELHQQTIIEKVTAELEVLKLQISPHFLFNTLNNIRWLARQKSDNTEDAIVKLSQLLRYIIYQAHHPKVFLEQEIEHLHNYILLQKMRLTEKSTVEYQVSGQFEHKMIEPLLFLPFVENAFKYGIHSQHRSTIRVSLQLRENELKFEVENPLFKELADDTLVSSGVGIANVQRRLELHYPNQHELSITEDDQRFKIYLSIQLSV